MLTFLELDEKTFVDTVLIIDIDGTITYDHGTKLEDSVIKKIRSIANIATIYLFSNGPRDRTRSFAELLHVSYIESLYRKPSRQVLEQFTHSEKRHIVIGDKALIDGIFAANIGARYIPVKRIRHENDSFKTKMSYILDDFLGLFIRMLYPLLPFIILLRPIQWIKNLLLFAPIFFAGRLFEVQAFTHAIWAMVIFCLVSSAMYILNDLFDHTQDKSHPIKRMRPIASGMISMRMGIILSLGLLYSALIIMYVFPSIISIVSIYIFLNILYSIKLKHVAVLDIICVAIAHILRVIAGGIATHTYVSGWILICTFCAALFIVVGKRHAEHRRNNQSIVHRKYSREMLDALLILSATMVVVYYGMYSVLNTLSPLLVYSTIFVIIIVFRLLHKIYNDIYTAETPELLLFKDPWILTACIGWIGFVFFCFYY